MKRVLIFFLGACIMACSGKPPNGEDSGVSKLSQKEMQYYSVGKELYGTYCANCHTADGVGLGTLIPPLKGSDYLMKDLGRTARIIKYGQRGPLMVNGKEYNQPMPANPKLKNLEIAEIITYISNSWGNAAKGFTTEGVRRALEQKEID